MRDYCAVATIAYKLALSQYLNQHVTQAMSTLRQFIAVSSTNYNVVLGRMLSLMMTIEYKFGSMQKALKLYDLALDIYSTTVGSNHPLCSFHISTLADLYRHSGDHAQAVVMLLLAQSVLRKSLGSQHLLHASIDCKVGAEYMELGKFKDAVVVLSSALAKYDEVLLELQQPHQQQQHQTQQSGDEETKSVGTETTAQHRRGDQFRNYIESEVLRCLYNLAISYSKFDKLDNAIHHAKRCINLGRTIFDFEVYVPPLLISCIILLSDCYVQQAELDVAIIVLESAWVVLKNKPFNYNKAGKAMAKMVCRILELSFASLPMQTQSLLEAIASEAAVGLHGASIPGLWEKGREVVMTALWTTDKPSLVFKRTIEGAQKNELFVEGKLVGYQLFLYLSYYLPHCLCCE